MRSADDEDPIPSEEQRRQGCRKLRITKGKDAPRLSGERLLCERGIV